MKTRKIAVHKFYLRLFALYQKHDYTLNSLDDVCRYFFGKLPTQSIKMRIIRNTISVLPTSITSISLWALSFRKKRYGRVASSICIELAASIAAKRNSSRQLEIYDPTSGGQQASYVIDIDTRLITQATQGQPSHNKPLIKFRELEISALTLLDPYLVGALEIIDVVTNIDCAHGCNYGWYKRNDVEAFEREFSDKYLLPDVNSFDTFYRYLSAPTVSTNKRRVLWIGSANIPTGSPDLIEGITAHSIDDQWLAKVYESLDEAVDIIHPHPSAKIDPMITIAQKHEIPLAPFNIDKVNINDKFIFHSINSSLIYYCLKFNLDFKVYSRTFSSKLYTPYFFSIIQHLEETGRIEYL